MILPEAPEVCSQLNTLAYPLAFLSYDDSGVDINSVARICLHFVCLNL
jgi:hypothetical protein